jgi:hypothetical protein
VIASGERPLVDVALQLQDPLLETGPLRDGRAGRCETSPCLLERGRVGRLDALGLGGLEQPVALVDERLLPGDDLIHLDRLGFPVVGQAVELAESALLRLVRDRLAAGLAERVLVVALRGRVGSQRRSVLSRADRGRCGFGPEPFRQVACSPCFGERVLPVPVRGLLRFELFDRLLELDELVAGRERVELLARDGDRDGRLGGELLAPLELRELAGRGSQLRFEGLPCGRLLARSLIPGADLGETALRVGDGR